MNIFIPCVLFSIILSLVYFSNYTESYIRLIDIGKNIRGHINCCKRDRYREDTPISDKFRGHRYFRHRTRNNALNQKQQYYN